MASSKKSSAKKKSASARDRAPRKLSSAAFAALVQKSYDSLVAPKGFTKELRADIEERNLWNSNTGKSRRVKVTLRVMTLTGDDITIEFDFGWESDGEYLANGSTKYSALDSAGQKGSYSFDRTGVEASFDLYAKLPSYLASFGKEEKPWLDEKGRPMYHTPETINDLVAQQIERVAKSRVSIASKKPMPLGWLISDKKKSEDVAALSAGKSEDVAALSAGKSVTYTPSGFGTGYHISRRQAYRHSERHAALEAYYGISPLFIDRLDCD